MLPRLTLVACSCLCDLLWRGSAVVTHPWIPSVPLGCVAKAFAGLSVRKQYVLRVKLFQATARRSFNAITVEDANHPTTLML